MVPVLIVDDSNLIRKSLELEFKKNNFFHLIFASDYATSEQIIEDNSTLFAAIVGTVLSDAPNGEIVNLVLSHKIPTIVLTGHISDDVVKTYSQKPIIDYVPKTSIYDILYTVEMIEILFYFQGRKALIVDNNPTTCYHISSFFKHLMFEPITALSSKEALSILENDKTIQMVSIDCNIAGMDGVELVQNINLMYASRGLSLLAITSDDDSTLISKLIKSGADDLLNKPVTKESFNARVFKILSFKKKMFETAEYLETMEKYVLTSSTDEKGIIRQVSTSFSELSGYTKEEFIGRSHSLVRHPDMPNELFKGLWKTLHEGESWDGEIKNRKKDGGYYWVHAHVSPLYNNNHKLIGYQSIRQDITDKKSVEEKSAQLEEAKQKITDSIEFSSIIQRAFLPSDEDIANQYDEFFMHWDPKDIVGGDIYQFIEDKDRSLLFMIDCTGHGVPGAFMTMVIKTALENIVNEANFENPAKILQQLSKTVKALLKQHDEDAQSDAGLDGGVFFYDKKSRRIRYAGAKTPLFYIIGNELKVFKSDRESIGYKKSNENFEFTNFELDITEKSYFYITTDGYIDQNGGEGGYPYGKKKFQKTLEEEHLLPFAEQKSVLLEKLRLYQGEHERDDDITMCGFLLEPNSAGTSVKDNKLFVKDFDEYTSDTMQELEKRIESFVISGELQRPKLEKVLTILYEMGQNILKYSCIPKELEDNNRWLSLLSAGSTSENIFYIQSSNIINHEQKERIASRVEHINSLDAAGIKAYYKELRKSGRYQHEKGAGLGFAELAKRSQRTLEYNFESIDENYDYYTLKVYM